MLWETGLQFWETSGIPSKRGTGVKSEGAAKTLEDSIDGVEPQVIDPIAQRMIMGPRRSLQVVSTQQPHVVMGRLVGVLDGPGLSTHLRG